MRTLLRLMFQLCNSRWIDCLFYFSPRAQLRNWQIASWALMSYFQSSQIWRNVSSRGLEEIKSNRKTTWGFSLFCSQLNEALHLLSIMAKMYIALIKLPIPSVQVSFQFWSLFNQSNDIPYSLDKQLPSLIFSIIGKIYFVQVLIQFV